ncbi:methyltransferase domain-containing protein [Gilvimarinus sp. SDUM040013]|uniref:Methyltransferase domain-containing protein n=1 Tax=Gilvimarinus gilvus TaxID=3058038 RepID=A0ABU4S1U1_9GAMM|nr:class I SAM-dependent methyltransferase [Gilvimarinus sp. SDUM040013]MDO3384755.1 methyltransferase domain-containing protein [Gilvimarinus sp. SDUM040013]MDX6850427.1 methyltransferase domain-containing protein [Gilvimarinus sp. SDUM040013]
MTSRDPRVPDWQALELSKTWADELDLARPSGLWRFLRSIFGQRRQVVVDAGHDLFRAIPKYALQEFHNLPNGNYSSRIARGYITGFDRAMLGSMHRIRQEIAERVTDAKAVLDIGTGGGKLAAAVQSVGVADVWGADVSPYLLKHAATDNPGVSFIQAPAEDLPFTDQRFDAVVVSFLFHEMPPKYVKQALAEAHRVLRPGGCLLIAEPSENQLLPVKLASLLTAKGWRHWYFKSLASRVYEPFVMAWHKQNKPAMFAEAGFELLQHRDEIPINFYSLKKRSTT